MQNAEAKRPFQPKRFNAQFHYLKSIFLCSYARKTQRSCKELEHHIIKLDFFQCPYSRRQSPSPHNFKKAHYNFPTFSWSLSLDSTSRRINTGSVRPEKEMGRKRYQLKTNVITSQSNK